MDTYRCFSELQRCEKAFTIEVCDRGSVVTIFAPHGGRIEPHTADIAKLIAGKDFNYYGFIGAKEGCNRVLHITSHRFDEERALALAQRSETVIVIHGCTRKEKQVFLGGLDNCLKQRIAANLERERIPHVHSVKRFSGIHADNICNRGITGKGVQLEISRPLRDDPEAWSAIARGVRAAIAPEKKPHG